MAWGRRSLVLVCLAAPVARAEEAEPDADGLAERARTAARSMPGCFRMDGRGVDRWDAGLLGRGEHRWTLTGTLRDGSWSPLEVAATPDSPDTPDKDVRRGSLFGRDATENSDAGREAFLEALEDDVGVEYVVRAGEGWNFVRTLKGGEALRNTLTVGFDAALQPRRWIIHIQDPVRVVGRKGNGAKVVWMELSLETDAAGAPRAERIDGKFASWPFAVEVHATTDWSASPC